MNVRGTLPFLAHRAAWQYRLLLNRIIRREGYQVTPEHFIVLEFLYKNGPASQTQISAILVKDKANVTRLIQRLLGERYIERTRTPEDRRSYTLSLTETGIKVAQNLEQKFIMLKEIVDQRFGPEKMEQLKEYLQEVSDCLKYVLKDLDEYEDGKNELLTQMQSGNIMFPLNDGGPDNVTDSGVADAAAAADA